MWWYMYVNKNCSVTILMHFLKIVRDMFCQKMGQNYSTDPYFYIPSLSN